MQNVARKITGPREMPPSARKTSGGGSGGGNTLSVPRKPVGSAEYTTGNNKEYGGSGQKSPGEFVIVKLVEGTRADDCAF